MKLLYFIVIVVLLSSCNTKTHQDKSIPSFLTKAEIQDKIKGGWAGQVIGCTYGGPTEFKYNGMIIHDYVQIDWNDTLLKWWYDNGPGLYDDIYMDLTFVEVFERCGIDAPTDSFALQFAHAGYHLHHANQQARTNILAGIMPPESGHWLNNPHADDIDFQIEADFAGLMCPGMPNEAIRICDSIGHIMNSGDGWYGGVYVATMYSLAFIMKDADKIVREALKAIPPQSAFYQCIADVIKAYDNNPNDWKKAWCEIEMKWGNTDNYCPQCALHPLNIDAKLNSAYVVMGMLYGQGDYGKSIDISTRCGQDSDCNPATVAGILGTMLGYSNIPDYWKQGIDKVETMNFDYTDISLNNVFELSYKHALQMLMKNDVDICGDSIFLTNNSSIQMVTFEQNFTDRVPLNRIKINKNKLGNEYTFDFTGTGFAVNGWITNKKGRDKLNNIDLRLEVTIDGVKDTVLRPTWRAISHYDPYYIFNLAEEHHQVKLKFLEDYDFISIDLREVLVFGEIKN